MTKLRNGHAPGHVREAFLNAIDAFVSWAEGEPEPTIEFEVNYEPHQIPISRACGLLWNCTDIVPATYFEWLRDDADLEIGRRTYAACARAVLSAIHRTAPQIA